jgi:peptide/nickel transport system permease protein
MLRYIARRLLAAIPVIFGVSLLVFSIMYALRGDPVGAALSEMGGVSKEQIQELRRQLGLDDPLWVQYPRFISRVVRGDFGRSLFSRQPVIAAIKEQLPSTIELTIAGLGLAIAMGVILGTLAAVWRNSWIDNLSMFLALIGVSMPSFWLGLLLIFLFALKLGWLPSIGQGGIERLIMPAFTLGVNAAAIIARMVRSSLLEVLNQEYMTTARAKGLHERVVILKHGLRNALIPVVTVIGLQFGGLMAGTVIIETVFARRGVGRLLVEAIIARDYPVVQGVIFMLATIYVLVNLLVDLSYGFLDPRIRYS